MNGKVDGAFPENLEGMSCRELVELVSEYLDGTLPTAERARFDAHLAECPGCATYLDQMRITVETVGELDVESISAEARDELLRVFRTWPR